MQHPFWQLLHKEEKSVQDQCLLAGIVNLSGSIYSNLTFEQIYDRLFCNDQSFTVFTVIERLNQIEKRLIDMTTAQDRIKAVADQEVTLLAAIQQAIGNVQTSSDAADARLEADIASLRNLIGSGGGGDSAALTAIADSLEQTLAGHQQVTSQLSDIATKQANVDVLTISPASVSVVRNATQQFTASDPAATFAANSGSVDTTGLYTPPADTTITSDVVTATSAAQSATASVSITEPTQ